MNATEEGVIDNDTICSLESVPNTLPINGSKANESAPVDSITQMWSEEALRPRESPSGSPCPNWDSAREEAAVTPECDTKRSRDSNEEHPGECEWNVVRDGNEGTASLSTSECGSLEGTQAETLQEVDNLHQGLQMGNAELGLGSIILTYDQKAAAKTMGHCLSSPEGKKALEGLDRLIWKSRKEMGLVNWEFGDGITEEALGSLVTESKNQNSVNEANPSSSSRDQEHDELVDDNPNRKIRSDTKMCRIVDKSIAAVCTGVEKRGSCQVGNQLSGQLGSYRDNGTSSTIEDHTLSRISSPHCQETEAQENPASGANVTLVNDVDVGQSPAEHFTQSNANGSQAQDCVVTVGDKSVEDGLLKKPAMMTAWDVLQSALESERSKVHTVADDSVNARGCKAGCSCEGKQDAVHRCLADNKKALSDKRSKTLLSSAAPDVSAPSTDQHHTSEVTEATPGPSYYAPCSRMLHVALEEACPSPTTRPGSVLVPSVRCNSHKKSCSTSPQKLMSSIQPVHCKGAPSGPIFDSECEVDTVPDSDDEGYTLEESIAVDSGNTHTTLVAAGAAEAQTMRRHVGSRRRTDKERREHANKLLTRNHQKLSSVFGKYSSARGELCSGRSKASGMTTLTYNSRSDRCKNGERCPHLQPNLALKPIKQKSCAMSSDEKVQRKAQQRGAVNGTHFYDIPGSDSDTERAASPTHVVQNLHRQPDSHKHVTSASPHQKIVNTESPCFEKVSVRSDHHMSEKASLPCLCTPGRIPLEENLHQDTLRNGGYAAEKRVTESALVAFPLSCTPGKGVPRSIASHPPVSIFGGMTFVVTGFGKETEEIKSKITCHGGVIIKSCGGPCPVITHAQQHLPDIVVSTKTSRSSQYLACVARGCGAVTKRWVEDCISAGYCVRTDPLLDHVSLPSRPHLREHPLFLGYHIIVYGSGPIHAAVCCVLRHAGAVVLQGSESENLPEKTGVSQSRNLHILVDEDSKLSTKRLQGLSSSTFLNHMNAVVKCKNWVVESILKGELLEQDGPYQKRAAHLRSENRSSLTKSAAEETKKLRVQNISSRVSMKGRKSASSSDDADNPSLSQLRRPSKRQRIRDPENMEQTCNTQHEQPKTSPAHPTSMIEDNVLRTPSRALGHCASQGQECVSMPPTPDAVMSISLPGFNQGPSCVSHQNPTHHKLRWVGLPLSPGQGGRHKTYYGGFLLGGVEIKVGDCVELYPSAGETNCRVVKIEALWSEFPQDGCERRLARARRFYLPQEVCIPIASVSGEVYSTNHIEERVPLQAILKPCYVQILDVLGSSREHAVKDKQDSSQECYRCSLHYNQEEGTMEQTRLTCGVATSGQSNDKVGASHF